MPGRDVVLLSVNNTMFGATVDGNACSVTAASIVCTGKTTPQKISQPLFAITCGTQRYVGSDLYHFSPQRTDETEPIRSYVCSGQTASIRPNITLLGWFPDGACAVIEAGT